jgi:hypothetical protein
MKIQRYVIVWLLLSVAVSACSRLVDENTLGARLSKVENVEEMSQLATELKSRGKRGIPGLLLALSAVSAQDRWALVEYRRINVCIMALHELAKAGVYTDDEVSVLIRTIEIQIYMPETFVTAETLRIITGVDPGYSKEFVNSCSGSEIDEKIRGEKIAKWRKWSLEHDRKAQHH